MIFRPVDPLIFVLVCDRESRHSNSPLDVSNSQRIENSIP